MPSSEFLDYEPLRRRSKKSEADEAEPLSKVAAKDPEPRPFANSTGPATETQAIPNKSASLKTEPMRVRGHGLSFAGLFLFTFLVYFRPYEWSSSLMWLSTSAFWVAVLTLAVFLPTQLSLENRPTIRSPEINAVLLLVAMGIISTPLASDPGRAWTTLLEYLKVVVMFIVMVNVVRTPRRLYLLLTLVLLVSFVLSVSAMNDYRLGRLGIKGDRIAGALGGLFSNPNDLALHLVTIIPLCFAMLFGTQNFLKKLLMLGLGLTLIGGIVATFSRGGFLGLVAATLFFCWKIAPRYRIPFLALGLLIVVVVLAVAPSAYWNRISTTGDDSAIARTDDLKRSLFIAARHPLLGVGMGNYEIYSNHEKVTHNAYTQVAAEMGLFALGFYLWFLIAALKNLKKIEVSSLASGGRSQFYYLAIGLQAGLLGYMVSSTFAAVAYLWYVYYLVGYSVCLTRFFAFEQAKTPGLVLQTSNESRS
jgi:O-antigen ligase